MRIAARIAWLTIFLGCAAQPEALPPAAAPRLQDAIKALRESDPERALKLAEGVVALAPQHAHAHFVRGQAHYALADFAAARAAWETVAALDPGNWAWYQSLGDAAFQQRDYSASLAYYKRSLQLHPDPVSWHGAAGAYWELGKPQEARRAIARALALDSTYAPAYISLSLIAEHAGQLEEAMHFAEQALSLGPGEISFMLAAGRLHRLLGRPREAIPLLRQVLDAAPLNAEARYNLAQALRDAEMAERAARVMAPATDP